MSFGLFIDAWIRGVLLQKGVIVYVGGFVVLGGCSKWLVSGLWIGGYYRQLLVFLLVIVTTAVKQLLYQ